ncbi:ABC transporter substrate-binding protein [uncultured Aquincola sp.]|uniref:ABC transporter substrate-binding protein n=1 Tax=uncultured Aquincola sp. TaxID=886556 RepID=UPI0032B296C0|tara:strand:+ start:7109 stop:8056 length:948 start_codon:yes stop_codon:yes gene_type:complete
MNVLTRRRWKSWAAAVAAGLCLFLAGAAGAAATADLSPEQAGRVRAERDAQAVAALPPGWQPVQPGAFTVAIHPAAPPVSTYATDARTVVGADVDIAQLVADALGLKLVLQPVAWADWPLGLASGRYDAVISNVGVTEQRKEKFDFSTYRQGLHGFYVPVGSPIQRLAQPKDVAGLRIITSSGTIQERILLEWNRQNQAAGLAALTLQYHDDDAARTLALVSGRADASFNPNAAQAWAAARDGRMRRVGLVNAGWPLKADVAITTRKGSGLVPAVTAALNRLIDNGKYAQALARWGLEAEALTKAETNPPGLPKF